MDLEKVEFRQIKLSTRIAGKSGFSLVELLAVVAIIGILAVIAVPAFVAYKVKAREGEAKLALSAIHSGQTAYFLEHNNYTPFLKRIGYSPSGIVRYNTGFGQLVALEPINSAGICSGPNAYGTDPNCTINKPVPMLPVSAHVDTTLKTYIAVAYGYESSMLAMENTKQIKSWWEMALQPETAHACDCSFMPYTSRPVRAWSMDSNKQLSQQTLVGIDFVQ